MKYYNAEIRVVSNGFVVKIGCQTVVAESAESLKKMICDYLDNPADAEKKLRANSLVMGVEVAQDERVEQINPVDNRRIATELNGQSEIGRPTTIENTR